MQSDTFHGRTLSENHWIAAYFDGFTHAPPGGVDSE